MATVFETERCSRCGGTGRYSYCQMHGDTCFKCGGNKVVLSKRGAAAMQYLRELRTVPASSVVPGMVVADHGRKFTVVNVIPRPRASTNGITGEVYDMVELEGEKSSSGLVVCTTSTVMVLPGDKAEITRQIEQALAYQATLTKAGKPRRAA